MMMSRHIGIDESPNRYCSRITGDSSLILVTEELPTIRELWRVRSLPRLAQALISFGYGMEQSVLCGVSSTSALVRLPPQWTQRPIHI